MNKSPLRYPGGKTRACGVLETICIDNFGVPHTLYSPFLGGGSFELHMKSKYECKIIASDGFEPLAVFWKEIKRNSCELYNYVSSHLKPLTKERFQELRTLILNETNPIVIAAYYFALNRCSFSGATLSGGFSKDAEASRFNTHSINRLKEVSLDNMEVSHARFEESLAAYDPSEHDVIFLDPPYYIESKLYGVKGDMHERFDHDGLANILKNKGRWMLCYNDCNYIRQLYAGYKIVKVAWNYGMNKSKKSSEIVIISTMERI